MRTMKNLILLVIIKGWYFRTMRITDYLKLNSEFYWNYDLSIFWKETHVRVGLVRFHLMRTMKKYYIVDNNENV